MLLGVKGRIWVGASNPDSHSGTYPASPPPPIPATFRLAFCFLPAILWGCSSSRSRSGRLPVCVRRFRCVFYCLLEFCREGAGSIFAHGHQGGVFCAFFLGDAAGEIGVAPVGVQEARVAPPAEYRVPEGYEGVAVRVWTGEYFSF